MGAGVLVSWGTEQILILFEIDCYESFYENIKPQLTDRFILCVSFIIFVCLLIKFQNHLAFKITLNIIPTVPDFNTI